MWVIAEIDKKQYMFKKGDVVKVQKTGHVGGDLLIDTVLLLVDGNTVSVGNPYLAGVQIKADITSEEKDKKVVIYKYKRRKKYRKKQGHRQIHTFLKISDIIISK